MKQMVMIGLTVVVAAFSLCSAVGGEKQRVLVLTDISNEPDDEESMVRFLVYSNEYDVEGLIATTSTWLRNQTREDLIRRQVKAYGEVKTMLAEHAAGYPEAADLESVIHTGQAGYGMEFVGNGKSTPGSNHIIASVDRPDSRPIWISIWGGANTLAQALWDVKATRTSSELSNFVEKIRVYSISDQDDAGRWLRITFPNLFYIVSPSHDSWKQYFEATWTGISGDRHYKNGPGYLFYLVDNPWLEEHIIQNHGPLGKLYPKLTYIMEGDTPSFLGLVQNGLGWHLNPGYGGWGGRYALEKTYAETRPIWTHTQDSRDTVHLTGKAHTSAQATIWRWRKHFQHDFAARMDWCVKSPMDANHNPIAILNGDRSKNILEISVKSGETVTLDATGSHDPDGDAITVSWLVYKEAGSFQDDLNLEPSTGWKTQFIAPDLDQPKTIHVILQIEDHGIPGLVAYRRAVVAVQPES